jgi:hypothetical protein
VKRWTGRWPLWCVGCDTTHDPEAPPPVLRSRRVGVDGRACVGPKLAAGPARPTREALSRLRNRAFSRRGSRGGPEGLDRRKAAGDARGQFIRIDELSGLDIRARWLDRRCSPDVQPRGNATPPLDNCQHDVRDVSRVPSSSRGGFFHVLIMF